MFELKLMKNTINISSTKINSGGTMSQLSDILIQKNLRRTNEYEMLDKCTGKSLVHI